MIIPTRIISILALLVCFGSAVPCLGEDVNFDLSDPAEQSHFSRDEKAVLLNATAAVVILGWGVANWDYFSQRPKFEREGWFGRNTKEGGADKVGHAFTAYAMSHGFSTIYRYWEFPPDEAALYGAWSAFGVTALMEVGDSFSETYGFSYEDLLMNIGGVALGYVSDRYPAMSRKIDFRWEYSPNFGNLEKDFVTDYEHSRYLLALKADGFEAVSSRWLKALELQLGYYTRGYSDYDPVLPDERKRSVYGGLGVNITYLLEPLWKTRLFNYYQPPYTYMSVEVRD